LKNIQNNSKRLTVPTVKGFEFLQVNDIIRCQSEIDLSFIKSYNKGKGGTIIMSDNSEIEVSTRRKDEFLKRLAEL
jgi:two-component system, LytTR family, response regulator